ncbi:MAG TPA: hypothetical protein VMS18_27240 [Candidatus Binatia bacterium]|nr:hypothetical protein [Candidatus Binatia bacterium]
MRIPQIIFTVGLVVLVVLLLTPRRHPLAYNAKIEIQLQGTVEDVREFYCPVSGEIGTHLTIATEKGTLQVHVAPSRFLNREQWQFSKGDQVFVVGAPIVLQGRRAIIARSITRGSEAIALRKEDGKPVWVN